MRFTKLWKSNRVATIFVLVLMVVMTLWAAAIVIGAWINPSQLAQVQKKGYLYTYTFSALTQSFAAILGFIGVFVVFRLQVQHSRISEAYNELRKFYAGIVRDYFRIGLLTEAELLTYGDSLASEDPTSKTQIEERTNELKSNLLKEQDLREEIKARFLPVTILLGLAMTLSFLLIGAAK